MRSDLTPAAQELVEAGIEFELVRTEPPSSVEESARLQGIEPERLLKSLIVRRGEEDYLFVLMPGPRQMSWPKLRRTLGVSRVTMPSAEEATRATGYERGAITPLGARHRWPVLADASLPDGTVAIGGGGRGVNVHLAAADLIAHLDATIADVSDP